jgi:hypothetical protein
MEKILAQFFLGDFVRRFVIMIGQQAHGAHIGFLRAYGKSGELQIFKKAARNFRFGTEFTRVRHGMPPWGKSGR